ncbi:chemotaxis protein CheW [Chitinimonas taiwanensis]|uniref:Chemotaxis protein CheW n=1 Tax=Chitinimonas taiwanensis DSM 18899 TaxID=1121279 RepID=A0A1K2HQB2_9NEIS|nr:chemotaxis protein CheW [Chitinimonas taiwanensis]SFZ78753.1 purine-binding chemotaxis protein CheW [Chitinimonas taiwanensis DSM 18899]
MEFNTSSNIASREHLVFTLGSEEYAIDILKVQEIRGFEQPTRIANTPPFLLGVINLRGAIVPIVDLRVKFQIGEARYDEFTVVVILNLAGRITGAVVDGVSDVIALTDNIIKPTPEFGAAVDTAYIVGLAPVDERMLILVDIEKLMGSRDMELIADAASAA